MLQKIKRVYRCQSNRFHKHVFRFIMGHVNVFSRNFPKLFLKYFYWNWMDKFPNFRLPEDINQFLLKSSVIHRNYKMRSVCADKYAVRNFVKERVGEGVLVKCYGVYDNFRDIDFKSLPDQFVMKMTNASGRNIICKDKTILNISAREVEDKFNLWLADTKFGIASGEWHYAHIKPRIIIEQYLSELGQSSLIDYKFHCFNGHVISCLVAFDRDADHPHSKVCLDDYDLQWNRTGGMKEEYNPKGKRIPRPHLLDEMVSAATRLSKGFDYVRVDLYDLVVDGVEKVMFGELTFTPNSNVMCYYKQEYLNKLGDLYKFYNKQ